VAEMEVAESEAVVIVLVFVLEKKVVFIKNQGIIKVIGNFNTVSAILYKVN
jgi:hypothetical protein